MKTITSAAIVGVLCVGGLVAPAAGRLRVALTAVMAPTTGPNTAVPHPGTATVQSSLRPATPVLSAPRRIASGPETSSFRIERRGPTTAHWAPNATYKLRINPKF